MIIYGTSIEGMSAVIMECVQEMLTLRNLLHIVCVMMDTQEDYATTASASVFVLIMI